MSKISIDLLSNKIRISSICLTMLFTLRLAILKPLIFFKKLSGLPWLLKLFCVGSHLFTHLDSANTSSLSRCFPLEVLVFWLYSPADAVGEMEDENFCLYGDDNSVEHPYLL